MLFLQLTDVHMQWKAVAALARLHRWTQIEQLFAGKVSNLTSWSLISTSSLY